VGRGAGAAEVEALSVHGPEGSRRSAARPRRRLRVGRLVAVLCGLLALAGGALVASAYLGGPTLASPAGPLSISSTIYDRNGNIVASVPDGIDRAPVALSAIPQTVQSAFVAIEDRRFYQNFNDGLDLRGIGRALLADLTGNPTQGASTISDQLAKALYLQDNGSMVYKLRELWLGIVLSARNSRSSILNQYLNVIYLGDGAYGVQAASLAYFGVPVSQVDLPQAATLAGLAQAPSAYDPRVDPQAALARRNQVLQAMAGNGDITAAQAAAAEAAPLELSAQPARVAANTNYPDAWFVDAVIEQLQQVDHITPQQLTSGGLRIYTTLDPTVQAAADKAVANLASNPSANSQLQAAEVVMDPQTGDVLAIVGGRKHTAPLAYDRALQAERQPGSSIKPLVDYTPALMNGLTPGTVVDDSLHTFHPAPGAPAYTPVDDNGIYYGLTTLTEALRRSVNTVAVQVLNRIGIQTGVATAQRMGLPLTSKDANLSVALGGTTDCCTPLDMADAYSTLANGGYHVTPRLVSRVVAPDGSVLLSDGMQKTRAIPANVAYVMTKMLETVDQPQPNKGWNVLSGPLDSNWGTGYDATVQDNVPGWPTAGKTGTTNSNEDAWYVGYTTKLAAAVWVGYDQPQPMPNMYGGTMAGPIFRETLTAALKGQTPTDFPRPAGVVQAPIDIKAAPWTVALPSALTPAADIRTEWFVAGTQPTQPSTLWTQVAVDPNDPSLRWDMACGDLPTTKVFLSRPPVTAAQDRRLALAAGVQNGWQSVVPVDMALRPPQQTCSTYQASGSGGLGG
jgi:penicillin-binding protein 1A